MHFFIPIIVLLIFTINLNIYAETSDSDLENSTKDLQSKYSDLKIHSVLVKWQESSNPIKFAQENNLPHKGKSVGVYIYLTDEHFQTELPSEIEIMSAYKETLFSFVNSEQLDKLRTLDYVEKVTPPDLAKTPPIPKLPETQIQNQEENQNDYLLWIVIGGMAVFVIIVLKYKVSEKNHD